IPSESNITVRGANPFLRKCAERSVQSTAACYISGTATWKIEDIGFDILISRDSNSIRSEILLKVAAAHGDGAAQSPKCINLFVTTSFPETRTVLLTAHQRI